MSVSPQVLPLLSPLSWWWQAPRMLVLWCRGTQPRVQSSISPWAWPDRTAPHLLTPAPWFLWAVERQTLSQWSLSTRLETVSPHTQFRLFHVSKPIHTCKFVISSIHTENWNCTLRRATTEWNLSYYHSESCLLESLSLSNLLSVSPLSPAAHLGRRIGARELFCEVERRPSRRVLHHLY